jgi:hypothetical protein
MDILSKCVHEDVAEYRATLEWMRLTIDWIIKSSHERRDDGRPSSSLPLLPKNSLIPHS